MRKGDSNLVEIIPEDWSYARVIAVTFQYERPELGNLTEVKPETFSSRFNMRFPVFVETDGACAGNQDKRSPGGWGAALVQGRMLCKRRGAKAATSNNEMEYQAMLSATELIPEGAYVCIESDSQGCIDESTNVRSDTLSD
jgi:hypothetical protein